MIALTNEKFLVTFEMLDAANMLRSSSGRMFEIGVPVNLDDLSKGLKWLLTSEMSDADFDTLEEYFLRKQQEAKK